MNDTILLERITANPGIFGGKPIVRGMRISVELILSLLAQGVTQQEFASQLGVDPGTLARWERGEREPQGRFAVILGERMRTGV